MRVVLHIAKCDFERGGNKWFVNECLELGRFFSVELKSNKSLRFYNIKLYFSKITSDRLAKLHIYTVCICIYLPRFF